MHKPDSIHIIADFSGCLPGTLETRSSGESALATAVKESGLNCIHINSHQFNPTGYTATALLAESHITLHTWPEFLSVQIDIFTCGDHNKARKAYAVLKQFFRPQKVAERVLHRDLKQITIE
ncbi:MAG: adenosylmethionine decarboxylase [Candidatus Riflebacteria bacterium HGW-Riflebacteria-1]|jgi:S-adenosylmethionine decarboxylase|nr:MAG: adenosylmethionine decarboxylase [Candidatus Riflebacteria bacterium HGW-Riflebacteria-1]